MSIKAAADTSYENLKDALADGKFPENVADKAVNICHRLKEPVRVSVIGLPGSGKSTLVNLLLNKIVVPDGVKLPTAHFLRADETQAVCTLSDGSSRVVRGADPHEIASLDPMFVEMYMPLPALGRISLLEVVAPADAKDQQRAMHWAAKRSDMTILCTREYTPIEQALWGSLPDHVKDHGFMLVTHADLLAQAGRLDQTLEELQFGSGHEFNKIMPIATPDAIAARHADGSVDKPLMQKSGGLTLISTILRHVDQGLRATIDQADLLLHRFRDAEPNADLARIVDMQTTPRPVSKPIGKLEDDKAAVAQEARDAAASPVVEVVSSKPVVADADANPAVSRSEILSADAFVLRGKSKAIPAEDAPRSEEPSKPDSAPLRIGKPVAPVAPAQSDAPRKSRTGFMPKAKSSKAILHATPETCAAYEQAIRYLTEQGRTLTARIDDLTSDDLMEASTDNIMWLSDHLDAVPVTNDPILEKGRTRALEATELVQLMQFENEADAGIEALTLMVQLKHDLQAAVALTQHHSQGSGRLNQTANASQHLKKT